MVFSNDRMKGVLEYLMAYGVGPRRLFMNILLASLLLVTVILLVVVGVSTGAYVARGNTLPVSMWQFMAIYSFPMSYGSVAFATTVGMYWTAISSPRMGLTSPTGFAPFLGILPPVAMLLSIAFIGIEFGGVTASTFLVAGALAIAVVAVIVVVLLGLVSRLLLRERLLSPA